MILDRTNHRVECDVVKTLYALIDKTCPVCGEPLEKFEFSKGDTVYICTSDDCEFYNKEHHDYK